MEIIGTTFRARRRRRTRRGITAHQRRFGACSRKCKGRGRSARNACMRRCM